MKTVSLLCCLLAVGCAQLAAAEQVKLPVTRDNSIMAHPRETKLNDGGHSGIKLKSWQHLMLTDFDTGKLKGKTISKAVLHVHYTGDTSRYADHLRRVGSSTVAAPWGEGSGRASIAKGGSCLVAAFYPDKLWAYPGSDLTAVIFGQGFTIYGSADATPPDRGGWQTIELDPKLVQACVAGISYGIIFYDDLGSDWRVEGDRVIPRHMPNRVVHSREQSRSAPYYVITVAGEDRDAPSAAAGLKADAEGLPAGQARLSWKAPADALGYFARYTDAATFNWDAATEVPRYLIPMAAREGQMQSMILRDLKLDPKKRILVGLRGVDAAGNLGPVATIAASPSEAPQSVTFTRQAARFIRTAGEPPKVAGLDVWVIDELDKVDAVDGQFVEKVPRDYKVSNHLWSAADRTIRLQGGRNEFVGLQIMLAGKADRVELNAGEFTGQGDKITVSFHREWYVPAAGRMLPDALLPLDRPLSVPSKLQAIPRQKHQGVFADVYIPHKAQPGQHTGTIDIAADGQTLSLKLVVEVASFTLPDELNFQCELNSYRTPGPPAEREYYRLTHLHRTTVNHLPYSQSGNIKSNCAPKLVNGKLDWTQWDLRFGRYFDGSAFDDLPRKGVPLASFYLPLHENWPGSVFDTYNGSFWVENAFPASYRQLFVDVSRQMAQHFRQKAWRRTQFQCYLNNKNSYRKRVRGSGSSPWILDEPVDQNDFGALAWFARAFKEGVEKTKADVNLVYRLDISRPQWQRNTLDGLVGLTVASSSAFRNYHRLVMDRARYNGEIVIVYGTTNKIESSNLDTLGWIWSTWCGGADGVLPWQTMGRSDSWNKADQLSVLYPGDRFGYKGAYPSLRLKAYRRGEQDVEYVPLLLKKTGWRRDALARSVLIALGLRPKIDVNAAYVEHAATVRFENLSSEDFWKLRTLIGNELAGR